MAKPAEHRAPSTRMGNVRPNGTADLVGPKWFITPLLPSEIVPKFAGGGMGGVQGAQGGGGKAEGGEGEEEFVSAKEFGGRLKKFEAKIESRITTALETGLTTGLAPILESIAKLTEAAAGQGGGAGAAGGKAEGGAGPGGDKDIESSPAFVGMKKKLEDLEKDNAKAKAEVLAEKKKAREDGRSRSLRETLQKQLAESGVPEDEVRRLTRATNELIRDGVVRYESEDDGADVVFMDKSDAVDLPTGIAGWLKTDIGKSWLPPRNSAGSGDGPFGRNPNKQSAGQKLSDEELAAHIFKFGSQ